MGDYSIEIKRSAAKEVDKISRKADRKRVVARIAALAEDPRPAGCKKFSGMNAYRIRQGPYRIIYEVRDSQSLIVIVNVGHRSDVYR